MDMNIQFIEWAMLAKPIFNTIIKLPVKSAALEA